MGDPADSPASAAEPSMMRRVRQSPGTSEATLLLFVIVAALWLEAAATAQVWYHSAPPATAFLLVRPSMPGWPSVSSEFFLCSVRSSTVCGLSASAGCSS